MANQQYQNQRSGGYVREVHVHYHQAATAQQERQQQSRQPSPEELAMAARLEKFSKTAFVVILTAIMPPAGIVLAIVCWWLKKSPSATATRAPANNAAANNAVAPLGLGSPAARQALSSNKKQLLASATSQKALVQPRKRLRLPFKRLPRP
jgi:hypothetical protein